MRRSLVLALMLLPACKNDAVVNGKGDVNGGDGGADEPTPLEFSLVTPSDAEYTDLVSVAASGTVSGDDPVVTVNGAAATLDGGDWTAPTPHADVLWPDSPLFPILGEATDAHGDWLRERVTLAVGDTADAGAPIPDAIGARLTDHALEVFDPVIQDVIADLDLGELLVTGAPVAEILGAQVYVTSASVGDITIDLDFTAAGLAYTLVATDVDATITLDFTWFDTSGDLAVDQVDVAGLVVMGAADGTLTLTPSDTTVVITGLEALGFDDPTGIVDGLLNTFLADTLASMLEEQVVALAEDLLGVLDAITHLEFSGMVLNSRFTGALHDADGVTVLAETAVQSTEGAMPALRFANPGAMPAVSGQTTAAGVPYSLALYLDDDLLSAIGAGLVGSGLLNQEISGDVGGLTLDTSLLGGLVPGFDTLPANEPVTLSTRPTLAPLGTPGEAAPEAGRLHIGGLVADLLVPTVQEEPVMTVALDALVGIGLGEEELLDVSVVDTDVTLLSTTLGSAPDEVEAGLDSLISLAVPMLLGDLLGGSLDLSAIPVELIPLDSGPEGDRAAVYMDIGDVSGLEL
jgi:hypothetical protein